MSRISDWVSEATFTLEEEKDDEKVWCYRLDTKIQVTVSTTSQVQYVLVLFAVVSKNEIFELDLHLDPLLIGERRPDVMGLGDGGLVRFQDHLGSVIVDMERSEDQNESGEGLEREHKLFTQV